MTSDRRLRDWMMWKVWLPFVFIAAMWPIYRFALHRHDAFQQAFAHGEFLIFSALALLEAGLELKHAQRPDADDFWPEVARFSAIFIVFSYGFVHMAVVRAEASPEFRHDLIYYACFSCSVAVAAIATSLLAYWRAKVAFASSQLPK
jgi:hypothetical protein